MAVAVSIAALAVSFLALVASAVALIRGEHREGGRRHDELQPNLTLTYQGTYTPPMFNNETWLLVRLRNDGPLSLDSVEGTLVPPAKHKPQPFNVFAAKPHDSSIGETATLGPLGLGDSVDIGLRPVDQRGPAPYTVRLRCTCANGSEEWTVLVPCEVPGQLMDLSDSVW